MNKLNGYRAIASGLLLSGLLGMASAFADDHEHERHQELLYSSVQDAGPYSDWARVLRVEPVLRQVQIATPHEECWEEPVKRYRTHGHGRHGGYRARSHTPMIVGGILGGVIGNQFGKGSGKTLATVAGAVLGGSMGRDTQRNDHAHHHRAARETYTTYERRCETSSSYRTETRNDGYLVDYEYNGRLYTTRTHTHPGNRIRVTVSVTPQS